MKTSGDIKEIATAMHIAQGNMTGAKKDSTNPFFKSSYSDLTSVMQAVSKPFFDNGLSFVQGAEYQDGMVAIVTRIMHISGQWIESTTLLPAVKNDPQAYGSTISYGRRYSLQSLAGVPSVDDDGQYASAATTELNEEKEKQQSEVLSEMIALIEADDIAFTVLWHECSREEQNIYWKGINTKQKKIAREMLNSDEGKKAA